MPSYYETIGGEEDTTLRYVMQITNSISGIIERVQVLLVYWEKKYKPLWDQDRQASLWYASLLCQLSSIMSHQLILTDTVSLSCCAWASCGIPDATA